MADEALRIANCSGFYGDRLAAPREMLEDGPIDVLTGDYLAELTMLILWRSQQSDDGSGYAGTFLKQMSDCLQLVADRGVRVVTNAGGLEPAGMAAELREMVEQAGVDLTVAHLEGDDLLDDLDRLREAGHGLHNLETGVPLAEDGRPPLTANAYLGGWGIAEALRAGADLVVCPRVTDASLTVGPAAAHFGWDRDDWDRLAGAVVAGHVIECGCQATGGNYSFFREVGGLEHPGFPIAEVHEDGSSVITKHPGTGGTVSTGTVTAQLLYEIQGHRYLNPDVTTRLETVRLEQTGPDRVGISGVVGEPPTDDLKVCINLFAGFRNRMTFLLTGLDIEGKADLLRRTIDRQLDRDDFDEIDVRLIRSDHEDPADNAEAIARMQVTVKSMDAETVGRRGFSGPLVELALSSYPGFTMTEPPSDGDPYGIYWPALVPKSEVTETVALPGGDARTIEQTPGDTDLADRGPVTPATPARDDGDAPTRRVPLGTVAGARSGDKGGNANIGVWAADEEAWPWLAGFLTTDRLRELVPEAADLRIDRVPLPNLRAVNFVVHGLLDEGVAAATRPDPQAKGLGEFLRARHVPIPAGLVDATG